MSNTSLLRIISCVVASISYLADAKEVIIFRGEHDEFTKITTCSESNALCSNATCTYCRCMTGQTYVQPRGRYGECVSNDLIVYATCKFFYNLMKLAAHDGLSNYFVVSRNNFAQPESVPLTGNQQALTNSLYIVLLTKRNFILYI